VKVEVTKDAAGKTKIRLLKEDPAANPTIDERLARLEVQRADAERRLVELEKLKK
jgi:hypothetical protein